MPKTLKWEIVEAKPERIHPDTPRFYLESSKRSTKTHAVWAERGSFMDPPEPNDYTVCKRELTEEWEPGSNTEWPTCEVCLRIVYGIYAYPCGLTYAP